MGKYKRLTIRNSDGTVSQPYGENIVERVFYRLAELEDKIERGELVENTVITYVNMARTDSKTLIEKALKYDELKAKIENGTLKFLQCKVGDKVYFIDEKKWCWEMIVAEIAILKKHIVYKIGNGRKQLRYVYDEDLGKKWFLTKAEAEKKLKELQNER